MASIDSIYSQVIILTHENAVALELDGYLLHAFYPCRPKVLYGKSAFYEHAKWDSKRRWNGREIVGCAFNEGVIRFLASDVFPDEHRGIIAEHDLRFNKEDCTAFEYLKMLGVDEILAERGIRDSIKPTGSSQPPSDILRDCLAYITAARRWVTPKCPHGHAEWVWLSSEPISRGRKPHYHWTTGFNDKRQNVPGTGNYLHTITSKLARWLVENVLVPRQNKFVFLCVRFLFVAHGSLQPLPIPEQVLSIVLTCLNVIVPQVFWQGACSPRLYD